MAELRKAEREERAGEDRENGSQSSTG
jgi:hypothetical protein